MSQYTFNPDFDILLQRGVAAENAFAKVMNAPSATVEHKEEPRAIEFGSVFIELEDLAQGPTGLSVSTAEWWVIQYAPDGRRVMIPTPTLRRLVEDVEAERGTTWGGYEKRVRGVVVPLHRFFKP